MQHNIDTCCGFLAAMILSMFSRPVCASFVGMQVDNITDNDDGLSEFAVYAVFDDPGDALSAVLGSQITVTTGFYHSTYNGTKSALPWKFFQNEFSDNPDVDSFVTIGMALGDGNQTALASGFDQQAFFEGNTLGNMASWITPAFETQGLAGDDLKVLVGVFAPLNDEFGQPGIVSGTMFVGYVKPGATHGSSAFTSFTTVPTPAALSLLLAAPFLSRRRRA